ncbi:hypothetical protein AG1IA_08620 [Rhizoctonia solani AG-1 IA]|uniref:Mitochondrial carrier protein n=1 Tax=Thanatephorus cucumeris (strain AG1-IA) TaxID=983506 RepID=L8WKU6_THACA|nr:hypothetical protein AG1IA_08620 [Rhizoctonia solani AG-1 IA]
MHQSCMRSTNPSNVLKILNTSNGTFSNIWAHSTETLISRTLLPKYLKCVACRHSERLAYSTRTRAGQNKDFLVVSLSSLPSFPSLPSLPILERCSASYLGPRRCHVGAGLIGRAPAIGPGQDSAAKRREWKVGCLVTTLAFFRQITQGHSWDTRDREEYCGQERYYWTLERFDTYSCESVRGRLVKFPSLAAPSSTANEKGSALPKLRPEANLASGACTRVAVGFLLSPLAVLKTRFESGAFEYTSIPQGLRSLVQTSGIRGLWQGFLPSVFRDAPYAGLFVASYEAAKNHGGMFAGSFATFMTHPFDMVKTSMQVRSEPEFNSFRGTFSAILRESGLLGFYSGMSLRMTRKMCSSAIGWTVYEGMLLAFKKRDELLRQREQRHESVTTITA